MGRTKIQIDKSEFISKIKELESNQKFSNRNDLANAVSEHMNITPAVVLLRIKEFDVQLQTPKGKRGRQPGTKLSAEHKQAMSNGRSSKRVIGNIKELRKEFPESRQGLLDKVEKGSLSAAIKAMCLSCTQYQTVEIKNCSCESCPLHSFRPYK